MWLSHLQNPRVNSVKQLHRVEPSVLTNTFFQISLYALARDTLFIHHSPTLFHSSLSSVFTLFTLLHSFTPSLINKDLRRQELWQNLVLHEFPATRLSRDCNLIFKVSRFIFEKRVLNYVMRIHITTSRYLWLFLMVH